MESIITKFTKYLVRGKSYDAFHGVLLASYLILILFISGCSLFSDNRIVVKPPPVDNIQRWIDNRNRWMILAYHVEKHFDTAGWTIEEIATELSLQEYYLEKKNRSDPL